MFEQGLYLNFDPSHLLWIGIDPVESAAGLADTASAPGRLPAAVNRMTSGMRLSVPSCSRTSWITRLVREPSSCHQVGQPSWSTARRTTGDACGARVPSPGQGPIRSGSATAAPPPNCMRSGISAGAGVTVEA